MPDIRRIFVEKKLGFSVEADHLLRDLTATLGIASLQQVRILARYDVEGLSDDEYRAALWTIFSEPPVDAVYEEEFNVATEDTVFAVEYLPGQYDQRADSTSQCLMLLCQGSRPAVACSKVFVFKGALTPEQTEKIKSYLINPVDSREASLLKPSTLNPPLPEPETVPILTGFNAADGTGL
jgi:phosphoribosylformylglycinamidine synthase